VLTPKSARIHGNWITYTLLVGILNDPNIPLEINLEVSFIKSFSSFIVIINKKVCMFRLKKVIF
jgi:hypothetical protein